MVYGFDSPDQRSRISHNHRKYLGKPILFLQINHFRSILGAKLGTSLSNRIKGLVNWSGLRHRFIHLRQWVSYLIPSS
jgi:hypothetical protein